MRNFPLITFIYLGLSLAASQSLSQESTKVPTEIDYRSDSKTVEHRIRSVVVYSDRAEIHREATLNLQAGYQWLHYADLPSNLQENSLRVILPDGFPGKIYQVIVEERYEHKGLSPLVQSQLKTLQNNYAELLDFQQQEKLSRRQEQFLKSLRLAEPFSVSGGKASYLPFQIPTQNLSSALDEVRLQGIDIQRRLQDLAAKIKDIQKKIELGHKQLGEASILTEQQWIRHVFVQVEAREKIRSTVQLHYMIPHAHWRPIYDVRADLNLEQGHVDMNLVNAGMVEQHTGEDWKDVSMTLSSLDPKPLYMPELKRWVLSERREEAPAAETLSAVDKITANLAPRGQSKKSETARSAINEGFAPAAPALKAMPSEADAQYEESAGIGADAKMSSEAFLKNLPAMVDQRKNEESTLGHNDIDFPLMALSQVFQPLGAIKNQLDVLERAQVQSRLFEIERHLGPPQSNTLSDPMLPAAQAGGRDISFTSPFLVNLKHDEPALKLPLRAQGFKGSLKYFSIPKKDSRVFLKAETKNSSSWPILGGRAQIFMNGDLVSKTDLPTIAEGGRFIVDLGVDENIITKRIVNRVSKEEGLVFKEHSTQVDVALEVQNNHSYPIQIQLKDHIPLSPLQDKIKVELLSVKPKPQQQGKDKILQWEVKIPAKKKEVIKFSYRVTHPKEYLVSEFD